MTAGPLLAIVRRAGRAAVWFVNWLFEDVKALFSAPKLDLPEDKIPAKERGVPDLSYYTGPVQHYIGLYNSFLSTNWKTATPDQGRLAWKQRVHGSWGLQAKGREALPFLLGLIRHSNPDAREDASFLLGQLKLDPATSEQLLACLANEEDLVAKSAVIEALGKLRYRQAIPALASLILDNDVDIDTRWNAADSLASIVGEDFSGPDKLQKAELWLSASTNKGV